MLANFFELIRFSVSHPFVFLVMFGTLLVEMIFDEMGHYYGDLCKKKWFKVMNVMELLVCLVWPLCGMDCKHGDVNITVL